MDGRANDMLELLNEGAKVEAEYDDEYEVLYENHYTLSSLVSSLHVQTIGFDFSCINVFSSELHSFLCAHRPI